jgi:type IV pilus assembly protein PilW
MTIVHSSERASSSQHGFTIIELMIALLIGLFIAGGLMTLVQDNKRAFSSQSQLAQLQDSERLAMTMMTDVIQAAGYFPNPAINTATSVLLASGSMVAGQAMTGTPGDTITVRYATNSGDGILNCAGMSNTTGAVVTYVNVFSVVVNAAGVSQLVCTLNNGTPYPLVSGVTQLGISYGINSTGTSNNVDTYKTTAQMAAADWNNVISVQITLTFTNPLYSGANQGQTQTIALTRTVGVMNQTGI